MSNAKSEEANESEVVEHDFAIVPHYIGRSLSMAQQGPKRTPSILKSNVCIADVGVILDILFSL